VARPAHDAIVPLPRPSSWSGGEPAEHRTALILTKIGVAAATIYATARIARHSRWRALLVAGAINSAYLLITRNNYAIANRPREIQ
jgi:hypothetical protein